jgi:hypothetical protein
MNERWESFLEDVPWFMNRRNHVEVGITQEPGAWAERSADFSRLFPALERLLKKASLTELEIDGKHYELFSWQRQDGRDCAWLSPAPSRRAPSSLLQEHQTLLASFGGVEERSNESEDTWLLNHNAVLTETEAKRDASFINAYKWAFDRAGVSIPIVLSEFYSIAREANGNTTLCHRTTGEIVLFAPDHNFAHIVPVPGCPKYSLYRIPGAETFSGWVSSITNQWLDSIS